MKKIFLTACFMIVSGIFALGAFAGGKTEKVPEGKLAVAASFDAMQELTKIVGQDKVYIHTIIPPGVGAHHFEPKAGDLKFLMDAKAVVYNGLGMEPWFDEALHAVKRENIRKICASDGIDPIKLTSSHHHEDEHHHDDEHDHDHDDHDEHHHDDEHDHDHDDDHEEHHHHHGDTDPHAWLSLESAKVMVQNIAAGLSEADPANASFYKANAATFVSEADALLQKYRDNFSKLTKHHFVVGHAAFGYLCRDLGLEQNSVRGVFSAGEPNAKQLAKLADYCNQYGITTVFSENAASPQVSETLAKEVGATVQKIYTIESAEDGLSYMERMTSNIEKIYKSLAQ